MLTSFLIRYGDRIDRPTRHTISVPFRYNEWIGRSAYDFAAATRRILDALPTIKGISSPTFTQQGNPRLNNEQFADTIRCILAEGHEPTIIL